MRDFSQIVRVAFRVVIHGRHDVSVGGAVAPQLIRHQLPRLAPLPFPKLAKEPLRGTGVAEPGFRSRLRPGQRLATGSAAHSGSSRTPHRGTRYRPADLGAA